MPAAEHRVKVPRGALRRSLERALRATDKEARDAGTIELARQYADMLDQTAQLWAAAVELVAAIRAEGDPIAGAHAQKLAGALNARQALADLGPKYLAALAALNLTTAARAARKDGGDGDQPDPAAAALARLHARARQRDAAAVDPAAAPSDS